MNITRTICAHLAATAFRLPRFAPLALALAALLLLSTCGEDQTGKDHPSVAFLVYDAGETLALLPVAGILRNQGFPVNWIPLTPWAAELLATNDEPFLALPDGIGAMAHLESREAETDVGYWAEALEEDPPGLVVSGLVSASQAQLGRWLRTAGVPTRGFHDGFQPPVPGSISVVSAPAFDEVWVPTARVRDGFHALGIPVVLAGQPTLEAWWRASEGVDPGTVRERLAVGAGRRVLLFAGQYGPGYAETLHSFLEGMGPALSADSSLILVVSHHPRTDGAVEAQALDRAGLPSAFLAPEGVSTMDIAVAADVVLTWTSTVGVQAAFMGRPVVYFSPPPDFDAHLVEEGIASRADPGDLAFTLAEVLQGRASPESIREALVRVGYVVGADSVVANLILTAVSRR